MTNEAKFCELVHTRAFDASAARTFSEAELAELEYFLAEHPEAGDVMPGAGGVRKLRVAAKGHGKNRGARVVYYYLPARDRIYLFAAFAKGEKELMTKDEERQLRLYVEQLKKGAD